MYQSNQNTMAAKTLSLQHIKKTRENSVKKRTVKVILLYKKGKITLRELITHVEKIKKYNFKQSNELTGILEEIYSFSAVDAMLNDILDELLEK